MFFLDFEDKLEKLDAQKKLLIESSKSGKTNNKSKIKNLEDKEIKELNNIYSNLSSWQIVKIARHPKRPKTLDYINNVFTKKKEIIISTLVKIILFTTL